MHTTDLKRFLEQNYRTYHRPEYLRLDPLICVRCFTRPEDKEIAGLVAAVLAYGRAETIIGSVSKIFERTGRSIADFTLSTSFEQKLHAFGNFKHRFNDGFDLALLLHAAGRIVKRHGSLESLFVKGCAPESRTIKKALDCFVAGIRRSAAAIVPQPKKSFNFFVTSPASGSACKRLNMYLRWMVRKNDGIDYGLWKNVSPAKLVIPLDTHVARIAQTIGLTKRSTVTWTMAEEITERLRFFDPVDPVRYDFSLCRSGMIGFRRKAA